MVLMGVKDGKGEGQGAPYQRVIEDGYVVGDCQEAPGSCFVVSARLEKVEEARKTIDF